MVNTFDFPSHPQILPAMLRHDLVRLVAPARSHPPRSKPCEAGRNVPQGVSSTNQGITKLANKNNITSTCKQCNAKKGKHIKVKTCTDNLGMHRHAKTSRPVPSSCTSSCESCAATTYF